MTPETERSMLARIRNLERNETRLTGLFIMAVFIFAIFQAIRH